MANLSLQQLLNADKMIGGSFDAVGAPPQYMSPPTSVAEMYRGILPPTQTAQAGMLGRGLPPSAGGSPYMTAEEKARFQQTYGNPTLSAFAPQPPVNPAVTAATGLANTVPLPRPRPPNFPTSMDMAAIRAYQAKQGADPGIGVGLLGGTLKWNPPPQVPPPGIAPTVWRGAPAQSPPPKLPRLPVGLTPAKVIQRQTGLSAPNAYAAANAAAAAKAAAKATKPLYQSSGGGGGGDWFSSVTRA